MARNKLDYSIYQQLFLGKCLRQLSIQINLELFHEEIKKYRDKFRVWGQNHLEYPRYGISLVNLTGSLDDAVDPACWPLDEWWRKFPDKIYWDHHFTKQTSLLASSCFDSLNPIKDNMIRSNLLLWHNTGHFKKHVDMVKGNITHLRLWGVSSTDYRLHYNSGECHEWEPGRLYLIDTIPEHWAEATGDNVYTFFIAVNLDSLPVIQTLLE
jgi:hypothetical protein